MAATRSKARPQVPRFGEERIRRWWPSKSLVLSLEMEERKVIIKKEEEKTFFFCVGASIPKSSQPGTET